MLAQIELRLAWDCLFGANARGLAWQRRGLPELGSVTLFWQILGSKAAITPHWKLRGVAPNTNLLSASLWAGLFERHVRKTCKLRLILPVLIPPHRRPINWTDASLNSAQPDQSKTRGCESTACCVRLGWNKHINLRWLASASLRGVVSTSLRKGKKKKAERWLITSWLI